MKIFPNKCLLDFTILSAQAGGQAHHGAMIANGHVAGQSQAFGSQSGSSSMVGQASGFSNAGGSSMAHGMRHLLFLIVCQNHLQLSIFQHNKVGCLNTEE